MTCFLLVHGSFHGPWCWTELTPLLRAAGHEVVTPDLAEAPSRHPHPDLQDYARHIAQIIAAQPGKVTLVGHSMGGLVASQTAELVPDRLSALAYISGLMLRDGETLHSFIAAYDHLGVEDLVLAAMNVSADGTLASFPPNAAPTIFYNRCTAESAAWATGQLRVQPTAVYASPLAVTAEKFGRVPRCYVECRNDRAVSLTYQRQMLLNTPCRTVYSLDADRSPFLSDPERLAACLLDMA